LVRPMLFASGVITAVLKFQRLKLLASCALPVCGIKSKKSYLYMKPKKVKIGTRFDSAFVSGTAFISSCFINFSYVTMSKLTMI
jgi:hypothetical protein